MTSSTCLADKDASQLDQGDVSCFIRMRILIEPAALMHLIGTKMDFVEDRLRCAVLSTVQLGTGLQPCVENLDGTCRREFVFINPNSKGSCGCGESFTT